MKNHASTFLKLAAGTLCCLVCFGCAAVISGAKQEIEIDSSPQGAELYVDGTCIGTTPTKVEIERMKEVFLVLKHEGYADTRVKIEQGSNRWLIVDLFIPGNLVWLFVDFMCGSWKSYLEDDIVVPLLLPDEKRIQLYDKNVILTNESGK